MTYAMMRHRVDYLSLQDLARYLHAMTILDIIMTPADKAWLRLVQKHPQEAIYEVDNGGGDTLTIIFAGDSALIKGFDHENALNQFGADVWDDTFFSATYDGVPPKLLAALDDEEVENTTFAMWYDNGWWQNVVLDNDGGKDYLLGYICSDATEWADWAKDYFETTITLDVVEKIYRGDAITAEDVNKLSPQRDGQAALAEIAAL